MGALGIFAIRCQAVHDKMLRILKSRFSPPRSLEISPLEQTGQLSQF